MKNLLVIYYSQTGQLKEIISNFVMTWNTSYHIDFVEIKCDDFSFPMSYKQFFDVFPETVLKLPSEIHYTIDEKDYDCVLLGFQPWFLHTSIPFNSFMQTDDFKKLVRNKPVVLVMDSRNTWRNSLHEVVVETEKNAGIIKGIFVFRNISNNRAGLFPLLYWLITGKKNSSFKMFQGGGILQEIIDSANVYGANAIAALDDANRHYTVIPHIDEEFTSIKYEQWAIEKYLKWATFIRRNDFKYRRFKLFLFRVWILFIFFVLTPFISKKAKK